MNESSRWVIRQTINMPYMMAIHTFVYTNPEISTCLAKKHREMFKTPWFVAWFNDSKEFFRPAIFKSTLIRKQLEQFFKDMSDMILIYGFAGYYCIKNMEKWILSDPTRYLTTLPFGVIPMRNASITNNGSRQCQTTLYGKYIHYTNTHTMQEMIAFESDDKYLDRFYSFRVFNNGAKFVPMYDGIAPVSGAYNSGSTTNIGYGDIIPISPFTALYRKKSLIEEAIEDQYDANFVLSHPQTFVTPRHIPDSKVADISESVYYGADTLSGARQTDTAAKQLYATQSVRWLVNKLNRQANGVETRPEEATRVKRKKAHGRCDQSDGIHTIAGYVDIVQTHNASVIVNIDTAQNQFEEEVCNVIGLPYIFYRYDSGVTARSSGTKGGGGGHSSNNEEQLNFYKTVLYEEMDHIFGILVRLFEEAYEATYHIIDVYSLSKYYSDIKEEDEEKQGRRNPHLGKSRKKDKDEDGDDIRHIDLEAMAKEQMARVRVSVQFERLKTRSVASLKVLLECFDKGIVDESYMKKYVQLIYGQEDELIYSRETKTKK